MEEKFSKATATIMLFVGALSMLTGFILASLTIEPQKEIVTQVDTLVVRDTLVLSDTVYVETMRTEVDTCWLYAIDTIERFVRVEVPIDYKHTKYSDCEVYHHGYMSGIDSVIVYPKTTYITKTTTIHDKAPRFSLGVQAGYGASKDGLSPYVGIGINYSLIQFGHSK